MPTILAREFKPSKHSQDGTEEIFYFGHSFCKVKASSQFRYPFFAPYLIRLLLCTNDALSSFIGIYIMTLAVVSHSARTRNEYDMWLTTVLNLLATFSNIARLPTGPWG